MNIMPYDFITLVNQNLNMKNLLLLLAAMFFASLAFSQVTSEKSNRESADTLRDYEQRHKAGQLNAGELKKFIQKRMDAGVYDNADLIEDYVKKITLDELGNYSEILFILKAGPIVDGPAYRATQFSRALVDSIYKTESLPLRIDINSRIIRNSLQKAIKTKNNNLAERASNYGYGTYSNNYKLAARAYAYTMMDYYKKVNDTTAFLNAASSYYDSYYLNLNIKEARKRIPVSEIFNQGIIDKPDPTATRRDSISNKQDQSYTDAGVILNDAAWDIFMTGTRQEKYLFKALQWSKMSINIQPDANYYDTLAQIFYRLGFYEEAIMNETKAIKMMKAGNGKDAAKKVLLKMKQRKL